MKIKTIFLGTSEFAIPVLERLIQMDFIDLRAVVTQPDRPVGRKQVMMAPPVGQWVKKNKEGRMKNEQEASGMGHGAEVSSLKSQTLDRKPITHNPELLQPEKIRLVADEILEKYQPELIIVASYGQILPKSIIDYPKYKCLNLHGSLLPELRGAVPIQMAVLQGLKKTGVTLQIMSEGMDEGDIVAKVEFGIEKDETTESLMKKASEKAANLLEDNLKNWVEGKIETEKQDSSKATYCYMSDVAKEKAEIKFETSVDVAERMVRAFYPWPVAWFVISEGKYVGRKVKVFGARVIEENKEERIKNEVEKTIPKQFGNKLQITKVNQKLILELRDGLLEITEVQLEGKERKSAKDYLYLV